MCYKNYLMTHTYNITGMTCGGCQAKVQKILSEVNGIDGVNIDLATGQTTVSMNRHIPTSTLKEALKGYPKYQISDVVPEQQPVAIPTEETISWIKTYKPVLLIFAYITGITLIIEFYHREFLWMRWMNDFMAGFFFAFSFFKFLNLKGFAESYRMYDIVAKKWPGWGYLYAFTELGLGVAFLTGFFPFMTNLVTLIIMSLSIVGVLQSVLNKQKIKCACLGDVFNLPMSTVTIIEDALMMVMSLVMLLTMI